MNWIPIRTHLTTCLFCSVFHRYFVDFVSVKHTVSIKLHTTREYVSRSWHHHSDHPDWHDHDLPMAQYRYRVAKAAHFCVWLQDLTQSTLYQLYSLTLHIKYTVPAEQGKLEEIHSYTYNCLLLQFHSVSRSMPDPPSHNQKLGHKSVEGDPQELGPPTASASLLAAALLPWYIQHH